MQSTKLDVFNPFKIQIINTITNVYYIIMMIKLKFFG